MRILFTKIGIFSIISKYWAYRSGIFTPNGKIKELNKMAWGKSLTSYLVWAGLEEKFEYKAKTVDKVAPWSKWTEGGQSAKWDSIGCVMMWWYMYIEGYIFVFWYTEEMGGAMFCFACLCLLSVTLFLHFLFSPPYMTFLTKSFFSFFSYFVS